MLTKKELKKKILSYAYEQYCASRKNTSSVGEFPLQQLLPALGAQKANEEYELSAALHELFIQNLIMKHEPRDSFVVAITPKGKEVAEKQLDIDEYSLRLENFIVNEELLNKCQDLFNGGEYETAIFSAFRLLEVKVRGKAGLSANDIGINLMKEAFSPNKGKLRIPTCATQSEETGILNLFLGAIQSFKNPTSHRIVDYEDPRAALRVMTFAEFLLNLLKISVKR